MSRLKQGRRIAPHRVGQDERAAGFGDGRPDALAELGAELPPLALALERKGRRDQALAAHHEHRDRQLVLDLSALGQDAGSAAADDDGRAGDAADGVQSFVGARVAVAGDEHQRQIGAVRPASPDRFERGLERGVVGRAADGETGSRGDHALDCNTALLHSSPPRVLDWRPSADHWMTWSARTSTDCGIVRPSAFAVLRLMTSSNFVGCSTGRSAGLAPFRILMS